MSILQNTHNPDVDGDNPRYHDQIGNAYIALQAALQCTGPPTWGNVKQVKALQAAFRSWLGNAYGDKRDQRRRLLLIVTHKQEQESENLTEELDPETIIGLLDELMGVIL